MHEGMVAQNLLAAISEEAEKHAAKPVSAKMSCGKLSAVNDEVLGFAFEIVAKGTVCEGLKLAIEHKPIRGKCNKCGQTFSIEIDDPKCSDCGCEEFALLPDAPLLLEEIEFQTD
mgnify:CR=1 FL=1